MTSKTNSIILYVSNVAASARYYAGILGQEPMEAGDTFAMFPLPSGLGLGLWGKEGVTPAAAGAGGACEVGFKVDMAEEVDRCHAQWQEKGVEILMPPTDLDFGRSFIAADPDGHRLRVYTVTDGA